MTLAFSTEIKGKPTYFVEKIINSLHYGLRLGSEINQYLQFEKYKYKTKNDFINKITEVKPKKHTIREDKSNRWKIGNDIHFVINNRTKNRLQIAPVVKVKSVQIIEIYKVANVYTPYTYKTKNNKTYQIAVDGNCLNADKMYLLAKNDGFEDMESFFDWFSEDFTGKLIHWTDARY